MAPHWASEQPEQASSRRFDRAAALLAGDLDDGLNLCFECCDRHARLGQILLLLGELEEAERELLESKRLDPLETSVRYNLGRLYENTGREESARPNRSLPVTPLARFSADHTDS